MRSRGGTASKAKKTTQEQPSKTLKLKRLLCYVANLVSLQGPVAKIPSKMTSRTPKKTRKSSSGVANMSPRSGPPQALPKRRRDRAKSRSGKREGGTRRHPQSPRSPGIDFQRNLLAARPRPRPGAPGLLLGRSWSLLAFLGRPLASRCVSLAFRE